MHCISGVRINFLLFLKADFESHFGILEYRFFFLIFKYRRLRSQNTVLTSGAASITSKNSCVASDGGL